MIDWEHVRNLRDEVGAEEFSEVVDLFLQEVDEKIAEISSGRGGSAEEDMHFLKGASANLGFSKLTALCSAAEKQARAGADEEIDLGEVFDCYDQSRAEFLEKSADQL